MQEGAERKGWKLVDGRDQGQLGGRTYNGVEPGLRHTLKENDYNYLGLLWGLWTQFSWSLTVVLQVGSLSSDADAVYQTELPQGHRHLLGTLESPGQLENMLDPSLVRCLGIRIFQSFQKILIQPRLRVMALEGVVQSCTSKCQFSHLKTDHH